MLINKIMEKRALKISGQHPGDPGLLRLFGFGNQTDSGIDISSDNATEVTSVMACVRVISETLMSVPFVLYKRLDNEGGKDRDRAHPLYKILRYTPNKWQSWAEFVELIGVHVSLRGNFYAEKIFNEKTGVITQLIPLHPDRVMPFMFNGERAFRYQPLQGEQRVIFQHEMFYVPGLSFDGIKGMNPIERARNAIALARGTEMFGGKFFANDAIPGIVIKHPGVKPLSDKAYKNIRNSFAERHQGVHKSHKPMILEEGMEIHQLGINPEDAQFLETRKYQRSEIAGMFRVPPHMIGDLENATFSNIGNLSRQFIDYSMIPWFVRIEQASYRDLLTEAEQETHFIEFNPSALLRGDLKTRFDAYARGRNWGWLSVNDVRKAENQNPIGEEGDIYLQPLNMGEAGDIEIDKPSQPRTQGNENE